MRVLGCCGLREALTLRFRLVPIWLGGQVRLRADVVHAAGALLYQPCLTPRWSSGKWVVVIAGGAVFKKYF